MRSLIAMLAVVTAAYAAGDGHLDEAPYRVGPFPDAVRAAALADFVRAAGVSVAVVADMADGGAVATEGPDNFIVVSEVLDEPAARRVMDNLAGQGFTDTWYVPDGPWTQRISAGVFARRELAERRSAVVSALGLQTSVARRNVARAHWLDLRTPYIEPDLVDAIRARLGSGETLRELHNVPRRLD